jgi:hypothetical protein
MTVIHDPSEAGADLVRLRHCLLALAEIGSEQPALFPEFRQTAEQAARDFDQCSAAVRETSGDALPRHQLDALGELDRKLQALSRDGAEFDADLWTDDAVRTSAHWSDIRRFARSALEAFGWGAEP